MSLSGGSFQITGAASVASNQTAPSVTTNNGINFLTLSPGATGGTSIMTTTGNLTINNGSTIVFRSLTLPSTPPSPKRPPRSSLVARRRWSATLCQGATGTNGSISSLRPATIL